MAEFWLANFDEDSQVDVQVSDIDFADQNPMGYLEIQGTDSTPVLNLPETIFHNCEVGNESFLNTEDTQEQLFSQSSVIHFEKGIKCSNIDDVLIESEEIQSMNIESSVYNYKNEVQEENTNATFSIVSGSSEVPCLAETKQKKIMQHVKHSCNLEQVKDLECSNYIVEKSVMSQTRVLADLPNSDNEPDVAVADEPHSAYDEIEHFPFETSMSTFENSSQIIESCSLSQPTSLIYADSTDDETSLGEKCTDPIGYKKVPSDTQMISDESKDCVEAIIDDVSQHSFMKEELHSINTKLLNQDEVYVSIDSGMKGSENTHLRIEASVSSEEQNTEGGKIYTEKNVFYDTSDYDELAEENSNNSITISTQSSNTASKAFTEISNPSYDSFDVNERPVTRFDSKFPNQKDIVSQDSQFNHTEDNHLSDEDSLTAGQMIESDGKNDIFKEASDYEETTVQSDNSVNVGIESEDENLNNNSPFHIAGGSKTEIEIDSEVSSTTEIFNSRILQKEEKADHSVEHHNLSSVDMGVETENDNLINNSLSNSSEHSPTEAENKMEVDSEIDTNYNLDQIQNSCTYSGASQRDEMNCKASNAKFDLTAFNEIKNHTFLGPYDDDSNDALEQAKDSCPTLESEFMSECDNTLLSTEPCCSFFKAKRLPSEEFSSLKNSDAQFQRKLVKHSNDTSSDIQPELLSDSQSTMPISYRRKRTSQPTAHLQTRSKRLRAQYSQSGKSSEKKNEITDESLNKKEDIKGVNSDADCSEASSHIVQNNDSFPTTSKSKVKERRQQKKSKKRVKSGKLWEKLLKTSPCKVKQIGKRKLREKVKKQSMSLLDSPNIKEKDCESEVLPQISTPDSENLKKSTIKFLTCKTPQSKFSHSSGSKPEYLYNCGNCNFGTNKVNNLISHMMISCVKQDTSWLDCNLNDMDKRQSIRGDLRDDGEPEANADPDEAEKPTPVIDAGNSDSSNTFYEESIHSESVDSEFSEHSHVSITLNESEIEQLIGPRFSFIHLLKL